MFKSLYLGNVIYNIEYWTQGWVVYGRYGLCVFQISDINGQVSGAISVSKQGAILQRFYCNGLLHGHVEYDIKDWWWLNITLTETFYIKILMHCVEWFHTVRGQTRYCQFTEWKTVLEYIPLCIQFRTSEQHVWTGTISSSLFQRIGLECFLY